MFDNIAGWDLMYSSHACDVQRPKFRITSLGVPIATWWVAPPALKEEQSILWSKNTSNWELSQARSTRVPLVRRHNAVSFGLSFNDERRMSRARTGHEGSLRGNSTKCWSYVFLILGCGISTAYPPCGIVG